MSNRLLLLSLLLLASPTLATPPELAPLLARLAASDAARDAREGTVPVVVTKKAEKLDRKGRVTARKERVTRHVGRGEAETVELLRQVEDGKDVTAARRAERARAKQKPARKSGAGELRSPFSAELQPHYRYTLEAGPADARGLVRVRFAPVEPSVDLLAGEALVDAAHGEPVVLEATQSKLPEMADFVKVRIELDGPPGGRDLVRIQTEAAGGMLFVHMHVRAVTTYAYERGGARASAP